VNGKHGSKKKGSSDDNSKKGKGGWLTLEQDAGKVLHSAKFVRRETLPRMFPDDPANQKLGHDGNGDIDED